MKYLKMLGLAVVGAMAFTAFTASSASATALEVEEWGVDESVNIEASLASGTSAVLSRTDGSLANTCTASSVAGDTEEPFSGTTVTGAVDSLSFTSCERTVTVHKPGVLHVEHIASTTNGTVSSSGAEVTVGSPFGTLNCKTGAGTDIGTLTGTASGSATMDINAVLNCGFLVPSAKWEGTYTVVSPVGLGVIQAVPRISMDKQVSWKFAVGVAEKIWFTDKANNFAYSVNQIKIVEEKGNVGKWVPFESKNCEPANVPAQTSLTYIICEMKVECTAKNDKAEAILYGSVGAQKFYKTFKAAKFECV